MNCVLQFDHPKAMDLAQVGGKAAGLAGMTAAKVPVPPGFVVPTSVYRMALKASGIEPQLRSLFADADDLDRAALAQKSQDAVALFAEMHVPMDIAAEIHSAYQQLAEEAGTSKLAVAVRSSATAEDTAGTSFAGEYETYLDINSVDDVIEHVVRCWRSLFSVQALTYALKAGLPPQEVAMSVVVQKMVRARSSGVMFTLSPVTGDRSRIVIEGAWGLGVGIVGGEVTPDSFVVSKIKHTIVSRHIADKLVEFQFGENRVAVPEDRRSIPSISDDEILAIAEIGVQLESHHGHPVDVEWAIDAECAESNELFMLQCRPETVWSNRESSPTITKNQAHLSSLMLDIATKVNRD